MEWLICMVADMKDKKDRDISPKWRKAIKKTLKKNKEVYKDVSRLCLSILKQSSAELAKY